MRNKIIVLLAGAVFSIALAATVQAEGVKIKGTIGGSIGSLTDDAGPMGSTGGLVVSSEHYIKFTAGGEKISVKAAIRARQQNGGAVFTRDADGTPTGVESTKKTKLNKYGTVKWKPIPTLSIVMGITTTPSWSNALNGAYTIINPVSDGEYDLSWSGASMADVTYAAGNMKFGLGISGQCLPSCGAVLKPSSPAVVLEAVQTLAPHFEGKFGGIAVRFQMPMASGIDPNTGDEHKGSGYRLGVGWSSGHMGAGVDVYTVKNTQSTSTGTGPTDFSYTATNSHISGNTIMVKGFGARLMMNYKSEAKDVGNPDPADPVGLYEVGLNNTRSMKLAYFIKANGGFIIPEYTRETVKDIGLGQTTVSTTKSVMRLVGMAKF